MIKTLLKIENLKKTFDGVKPVNNVSFEVLQQSIAIITGENGAGKTTLFNLISGLEKPTQGKIIYNGCNISDLPPLLIAQMGITRLYQKPRLFKNLLVWENMATASHNGSGSNLFLSLIKPKQVKQQNNIIKKQAIKILSDFGLQELSDKTAGELSYGEQKLISFGMIAMNGTKLALLDEPLAGLNPMMIEKLIDMILNMRKAGMTFIIIEHNLKKALTICDNHIIMNEGKIITE